MPKAPEQSNSGCTNSCPLSVEELPCDSRIARHEHETSQVYFHVDPGTPFSCMTLTMPKGVSYQGKPTQLIILIQPLTSQTPDPMAEFTRYTIKVLSVNVRMQDFVGLKSGVDVNASGNQECSMDSRIGARSGPNSREPTFSTKLF
jgi:hypothetical protein